MNRPNRPSDVDPPPLTRRIFRDATAAPSAHERSLLRLLMAQDGSATRICEAIAGVPLSLLVLRQTVTSTVPDVVRATLPGEQFIERFTSLAARGEIMMDNLAYIALSDLPETLRNGLDSRAVPIGHLLEMLWVRRKSMDAPVVRSLFERLWSVVGLPDISATRAYTIATPDGPRFVIAETFRRGMLMEPTAAPGSGAAASA